MVLVLNLIAIISFLAAGLFMLDMLATKTVFQQTAVYIGFGFTVLTFAVSIGLARLISEVQDIGKIVQAAAGSAGASDAFKEWEKKKKAG